MANQLIHEQSPYLLQHAHNPVNWLPWSDDAFKKAKLEHKPVIVSIGYAACHWCHVMERESFENEEVAAFMNEHFVCIKIDREEHPDVDHMYMDAVQALTGAGGWPLNVFATPERLPFYGGTYYPPRPAYNRPSWMQLLHRMAEIWKDQQDEVAQQSSQMLAHLQQISLRAAGTTGTTIPDRELCRKIADNLLQNGDKEYGGFGGAPKFPGTMAITFLLEHYQLTGYEPALKHALFSIDAMINGGIHDQLGGGFARYATDREWLVPHFEKMLYDNALLISVLCDAYLITKEERYRMAIETTIAFAERELRDEKGGYYCAIDADSEGEEGKFYTWTWDEWMVVLGAEHQAATAYFGVSESGNWEGTNILHVPAFLAAVAEDLGIPATHVKEQVEIAKSKLLQIRNNRVRPITDDKVLLSWNALMNIALSKAGVALGSSIYLDRAEAHMAWMQQAFFVSGQWKHTWKNGVARIGAKLDDLAYLAQAMLQLASSAGANKWLAIAADLVQSVKDDFAGAEGMFYYTPADQKDIPVRKIDVYDGAVPSANAYMANALWLCGMCMEQQEWTAQAAEMIHSMAASAQRYSASFAHWATLLQRHIYGCRTVICTGRDRVPARIALQKHYLPHIFSLTYEKEISVLPIFRNKDFSGNLLIFVCTEEACLSPVSSVEMALSLLGKA